MSQKIISSPDITHNGNVTKIYYKAEKHPIYHKASQAQVHQSFSTKASQG